jgi:hypothetical protein
MAVNGADTPITYNGSTWSTASITGPTVANLVWINLHNQRVWFGEKNSLDAWYLPVNSISGTALRFPLAGIARKGGYIMAAGTWSRDSFSGTTDYLVFLTSEGEAIIYGGTDPSSTTTWALQGVFRIGRPIGRRCMINAAADLIMITQDGFVQASTILPVDRAQADSAAISAQINPAVVTSANNYGSLFGWQPFIWPHGNMLIFNVPRNDGPSYQYVFNTLTQAPCRFTDINAVCWSLLSDTPYFGSPDGCVYQFGIVYDDAGGQIEGDALQAFNYFGRPAQKKVFPTIELVLECSETPNIGAGLAVDFDQSTGITAPSQIVPATEYFWDEARWDEGGWSNSQAVFSNWYGAGGIGRAAAPRLRCSMAGIQLSWLATNVMMTDGGPL